MKDVTIKVFQDGTIYTTLSKLGISCENLQGRLIFIFEDKFVDGIAYLEFERNFEKGYIPMNKVGETYEIEIKSSLLKTIGDISLQLRITEDENPNGIPVFKSEMFTLEVADAINATSEIPDDYPEWIDLANEKIKEMDNLNIATERVEDGVDIVLTDKKGNTTRTEVKDGAPGPVGPQGAPGAVKMQVVDTLPETGRTDTIYLVKKDNPSDQNLYDEYVYANGSWEHIGDTSVDLSDYYTKEETDGKISSIPIYTLVLEFDKRSNVLQSYYPVIDDMINLMLTKNIHRFILKIEYPNTIEHNRSKEYGFIGYNRVWQVSSTNSTVQFESLNTGCSNVGYATFSAGFKILGTISDGIFKTNLAMYTKGTDIYYNDLVHSSQVLTKTNTSEYTPTNDYNPSTKKYVDVIHYQNMAGYDATKTQVLKNINGTLTWVNE